jgi:hypothetical protein
MLVSYRKPSQTETLAFVAFVSNLAPALHQLNDMWFEGKWIKLEDMMLSEVSQAQKDKGHVFSLLCE